MGSICLLVLLCVISKVQLAAAQPANVPTIVSEPHGFVGNTPSDTAYSSRNGLRLQIDSRWPNNFGYRPIRVRIASKQPTKAEHRITLQMHVASWERTTGRIVVEQDFVMPLGATSAEGVLTCPQFDVRQIYWWEVWVDGAIDRDLGVSESTAWQLTSSSGVNPASSTLKFLIVDGKATSHSLTALGSDAFEGFTLSLASLPTRWIDYSAIDVVAISPDDLEVLAATRPAALEALRRWIRVGGQMWVNPAGENWEQIGAVERLLELHQLHDIEIQADTNTAMKLEITFTTPRGWQPIKFVNEAGENALASFRDLVTNETRVSNDPVEIAEMKSNPDYVLMEERVAPVANPAAEGDDAPKDSAKWYIQRPVGLGYVRAFRREWDPVGFSFAWRMLLGGGPNQPPAPPAPTSPLTAALETTRTWESRHGMTPNTANEDFANLLVPGVGLAPVTEFRVLITLFVLVIGPLNYWLLKRTNRLHLMLLTVPALAMALTVALFGYALFSDGLSTTARAHSFTTLDQDTGEAACWTRLSYYAGLAPNAGLTFLDDTVIYPIIAGWNMSTNSGLAAADRELIRGDDDQQLLGGWLRSRTPTQYLSIRARKSPHQIEFNLAGGTLSATNELGTAIKYIVVVDDTGDIFSGEQIADRATFELRSTTPATAHSQLRRLITENQPVTPPALDLDRGSAARMMRRQRRRYFNSQYGMDYSTKRLADNLPNDALAALSATTMQPLIALLPRSYVAITETGPEVELGIETATEEGSFHIIVAHW